MRLVSETIKKKKKKEEEEKGDFQSPASCEKREGEEIFQDREEMSNSSKFRAAFPKPGDDDDKVDTNRRNPAIMASSGLFQWKEKKKKDAHRITKTVCRVGDTFRT